MSAPATAQASGDARPRTVAVVTVGRSDYGIYLPILRRIQQMPALALQLVVAAAHLSPSAGLTVRQIEADGIPIAERVDLLLASDADAAVAKSVGLGVIGYAQAFDRLRPDLLLLLGDRFEMHAAAVAALPFRLPIAHVHGGEVTAGAFDDSLRHSLTKLSHLHFVSTEEYARRVAQLGEEPWRITVSGAPSLDTLAEVPLLSAAELEHAYGLQLSPPPLLVTFHPATLEPGQEDSQIGELLAALKQVGLPAIFTLPNADPGGLRIAGAIRQFVAAHPHSRLVDNFGTRAYFSLMAQAAAMVGNSSSGIIEAATFALPVVDVGSRQEGRVRGRNVLDTGYGRAEIVATIRRALAPAFRRSLRGMANPYGSGRASQVIVRRLAEVPLDGRLLVKRFVDMPPST